MATIVTTPSSTIGAMGRALLMLFFGSMMFLFGCVTVGQWRAESAGLVACSVVLLLGGLVFVSSALSRFGSLRGGGRFSVVGPSAVINRAVILTAATARNASQRAGRLRDRLISGERQFLSGSSLQQIK